MKNDMPDLKAVSPFYRDHVKRIIDLVIAIPVLIVSAISMAISAIAVKLDSPGPVLFKQDRLGKDGKVFKMIKFRSMCVEAEKTGSGVYSGKGDRRVTRVGRVIRATSLKGNDIIRQTTESLVNKGFREVSPIHFSTSRDLFSERTVLFDIYVRMNLLAWNQGQKAFYVA